MSNGADGRIANPILRISFIDVLHRYFGVQALSEKRCQLGRACNQIDADFAGNGRDSVHGRRFNHFDIHALGTRSEHLADK